MTRLRGLAAAGLVATVVDLAILATLRLGVGLPVIAADAISITVAAIVSFAIHRSLVFADDPQFRWISQPVTYVAVVVAGGALDVGVLRTLALLTDTETVAGLAVAKGGALVVAASFRLWSARVALFSVVHREQASPAGRPPAPGAVRLSVVVPAYQAAHEIGGTVARIREELADVAADGGVEIVVVDDGSTDDTAAAARVAGADVVVAPGVNRGKGGAVRQGMAAATGRTRVFTDADLSYSPDQIRTVLHEVEAGWDVVVGSRHHVDALALARAGRVRDLSSRVFNLVTTVVLLGRYRDTQCGLKGFRSDVAELLFAAGHVDGFAFDVELLHLVERHRLSLTEVPVQLEASEQSTVSLRRHAPRMVRDIFGVRRAAARGDYDLDELPLPPATTASASAEGTDPGL